MWQNFSRGRNDFEDYLIDWQVGVQFEIERREESSRKGAKVLSQYLG
jgi:hypothetical protein